MKKFFALLTVLTTVLLTQVTLAGDFPSRSEILEQVRKITSRYFNYSVRVGQGVLVGNNTLLGTDTIPLDGYQCLSKKGYITLSENTHALKQWYDVRNIELTDKGRQVTRIENGSMIFVITEVIPKAIIGDIEFIDGFNAKALISCDVNVSDMGRCVAPNLKITLVAKIKMFDNGWRVQESEAIASK
jgi:hypothetical protein